MRTVDNETPRFLWQDQAKAGNLQTRLCPNREKE
jgi:hypothetical protein